LQLAFNFWSKSVQRLSFHFTSWESMHSGVSEEAIPFPRPFGAHRGHASPVRFPSVGYFALHSLHMSGNGGSTGFFGGVLQLGLQAASPGGFPPPTAGLASRHRALYLLFCFTTSRAT